MFLILLPAHPAPALSKIPVEQAIGGPPLHLESGLAVAEPGQVIRNFSDTRVAAKMPPAAGSPITLVVIGDPCNGNMLGGGQCIFRDYYGVNKTLPVLLNAALPSSDIWYLTGHCGKSKKGRRKAVCFFSPRKDIRKQPLTRCFMQQRKHRDIC